MNHGLKLHPDGTLEITMPKGKKVGRVLVCESGTQNGSLYYPESDVPDIRTNAVSANRVDRMDNLIRRQDAIDDLHGKDPSQIWDTADIEVWINELPSAEPGRKKGKWIWDNKMPFERCRCSECGYYRQLKCPEPDNYCPNCGSDMREEKHVND